MYALSVVLLVLPFAVATRARARNMVVHESREAVPSGFIKLGAAPASHTLTLRLGLAHSDIAGLEERLMAVSTPSSADYGKFLTKEQVRDFPYFFASFALTFYRLRLTSRRRQKPLMLSTRSFPLMAYRRHPHLRPVTSSLSRSPLSRPTRFSRPSSIRSKLRKRARRRSARLSTQSRHYSRSISNMCILRPCVHCVIRRCYADLLVFQVPRPASEATTRYGSSTFGRQGDSDLRCCPGILLQRRYPDLCPGFLRDSLDRCKQH
jgi:hypothetical protein